MHEDDALEITGIPPPEARTPGAPPTEEELLAYATRVFWKLAEQVYEARVKVAAKKGQLQEAKDQHNSIVSRLYALAGLFKPQAAARMISQLEAKCGEIDHGKTEGG